MRKKLLIHFILSFMVCLNACNMFAMEERLPPIDRAFLGLSKHASQKIFCERLQQLAHILMFQDHFLMNVQQYQTIYHAFEAAERESRDVMGGDAKSFKPFSGGMQIKCDIKPPFTTPEAIITVLRNPNKVMGLDCTEQDMPFVEQLLGSTNDELVRIGHMIRTKIDAQEKFKVFMNKTLPLFRAMSFVNPDMFKSVPCRRYIEALDCIKNKVDIIKEKKKEENVNPFALKKLEKDLNVTHLPGAYKMYEKHRDDCLHLYNQIAHILHSLKKTREYLPYKRIIGDDNHNYLPRSLGEDLSFIDHIYMSEKAEKSFDRSLKEFRPTVNEMVNSSGPLTAEQLRSRLNQLSDDVFFQTALSMVQTLEKSNDPQAAKHLQNLKLRLSAASMAQLSSPQPLQLKEEKKSEPQLTKKQLYKQHEQQRKQKARLVRLKISHPEEQLDDELSTPSVFGNNCKLEEKLEDLSLDPADLFPTKKKKNKNKVKVLEDVGPELPIVQRADEILSADENMVTILDRRNRAQLCLFASKSDRRPQIHSCINYSKTIKQWFNNPEEVLALKGYIDQSNGQWRSPYTMDAPTTDSNSLRRKILIHNFSKLVDKYIRSHGICGNIQSRIHEGEENISITIPGHIEHEDGTIESCLYAYFVSRGQRNPIDQRSTWYHRNIDFRRDLINEFLQQGHYNVKFPKLVSAASSSSSSSSSSSLSSSRDV